MSVPDPPRIYNIVHVDNLASIITDGCLWPDIVMAKRKGAAVIGNNEIKADRLLLPVGCHPGTRVADYVPFYFCPRSVMLYVIYKGNHPNVSYRDGQDQRRPSSRRHVRRRRVGIGRKEKMGIH